MNKTILILTSIILVFSFFYCKQDKDTEYSYADGSGNAYIITATSLEYLPVEPANSSSGIYDGGDYKKIELSKDQYDHIRQLLETAVLNTNVHTTDRIKTSGMIIINSNGKKKVIIIKPNCKEQLEIEAYLKSIRQ